MNKKPCNEDSSQDEFSEVNDNGLNLPPSIEAYDYLQKTTKFIEGQENVPDLVFTATRVLENFILNSQITHRKQTKITHFFKNN